MAERHRRRRAGDARHRMMLSHPEAPVAPAFGMAGEIEGVAKGEGGIAPFHDGREVEDGKDHGRDMGPRPAVASGATVPVTFRPPRPYVRDRKSTRLNSSH